jgi:hypothetical protein
VRLRPAWIQTILRIHAVWSGSMLFAISFSTCYRVCKRTARIVIRLRRCAGWSQTHYVGFVIARLKYFYLLKSKTLYSIYLHLYFSERFADDIIARMNLTALIDKTPDLSLQSNNEHS